MRRRGRLLRRFGAPLCNHRGVTLFELVILLVIAAIALPGLMIYFIASMNHSADAQMETMGLGLAQELMEEIKAKRWDQQAIPPQTIPPGAPTAANALGPEAGETRCDPAPPAVGCSPYNDIDDYNGLGPTPPQDPHGNPLPDYAGYLAQVTVCYVNGPLAVNEGGNNADAGVCLPTTTAPPLPDYKKITVTVTRGDTVRVQLDTVMANYHL
jgi:MSHA pilin protein MshD